jgi:hypothetical protein
MRRAKHYVKKYPAALLRGYFIVSIPQNVIAYYPVEDFLKAPPEGAYNSCFLSGVVSDKNIKFV